MDKYIKDALTALKERIPDDCNVEYKKIKKINGVMLDGFIVRENGNSIAPTFYLSEDDRTNLTPEEFAEQISGRFKKEMEKGIDFDIADFSDFDWIKSHLTFEVVNRQRNAETNYASIPITDDLMVVFKVAVGTNANMNASIRITNDHLKLWSDVTVEELLEEARRNSVIIDKAVFRSIADVILDMVADEYRYKYPDLPEEEFRARIKDEMFGKSDGMMYVLSTQRQSNAAMLYPDMLSSISQRLGDNIVLLPSSIHEVICLKQADALRFGLANLRSMVREINRDIVMQDNASDFLSDEILLFDGELKQINLDERSADEMLF